MSTTTPPEFNPYTGTDAPHEQLYPGQFQVESVTTYKLASCTDLDHLWRVTLTFTYAGAGDSVQGTGTDEQGAIADALRTAADCVCLISTEGRSE